MVFGLGDDAVDGTTVVVPAIGTAAADVAVVVIVSAPIGTFECEGLVADAATAVGCVVGGIGVVGWTNIGIAVIGGDG